MTVKVNTVQQIVGVKVTAMMDIAIVIQDGLVKIVVLVYMVVQMSIIIAKILVLIDASILILDNLSENDHLVEIFLLR